MFLQFTPVYTSNYNEDNNTISIYKTEQIKEKIDMAIREGHENIYLCGNNHIHFEDPLNREDLFLILKHSCSGGIRRIKLQTTLHSIESRKKIDQLSLHGVMFYQIQLFGHNADIHNSITGIDSFNKTMKGITLLKSTKVKFTQWSPFLHIDVIINKHNYPNIKEILFLAVNKKADIIHLSASYSHFAFDTIIKSFTEVIDFVLEKRSCVFLEDIPPCLAPGFEYFIYELYTKDIKVNEKIKISACNDCQYTGFCSGVKEDYIRKYSDKEFSPVTHSILDIDALEAIAENHGKIQI